MNALTPEESDRLTAATLDRLAWATALVGTLNARGYSVNQPLWREANAVRDKLQDLVAMSRYEGMKGVGKAES